MEEISLSLPQVDLLYFFNFRRVINARTECSLSVVFRELFTVAS